MSCASVWLIAIDLLSGSSLEMILPSRDDPEGLWGCALRRYARLEQLRELPYV